MNADSGHVVEELHDLVDGRLGDESRRRIEGHLQSCSACRLEHQQLVRLRAALRSAADEARVPYDLVQRVTAALDAEDAARRPARAGVVSWRRIALATGVAAAAVVVWFMVAGRSQGLVSEVADDFEQFQAGALPLEIASASAETIQGFFERRVAFPPRVFDLAMMGYTLIGGRVHEVDGRPSAFFVYRNRDGRVLVCEMFPARPTDLPDGAELRDNNGIRFRVYRDGDRTFVFWDEGAVICVLVSDLPSEDVVQLAFAKALKP